MNSVRPICYFRSNRIFSVWPKHTTRCHRFHNRKNSLPLILCFFWSSSTQWILSSTSITFLTLLCAVTQGPNPFTTNSRRPFLEIDVKGGEREITSNLNHFYRGENTQVERVTPDVGCSRGEKLHVFKRGKTCSYVLILYELWFCMILHFALIFCSLSSPSIPC